MKKSENYQSGQIAIVILLIMVVLLTIGLSLASRTTQELFLSQQDAESTRVFNAAESGIEERLSQDLSALSGPQTTTIYVDGIEVETLVTPNAQLETQITEGSSVHVNLDGVSLGDPINVKWSKDLASSDCNTHASLLATVYYEDAGTTKVEHYPFGPDSSCILSSPRDSDNFVQSSSALSPYNYQYNVILPASGTPLFMRIKAIYADTHLRVEGAVANQYFVIRAEANSPDAEVGNEEGRTIEVGRGLSAAPSFMDYALYSGGNLAQ